MGPYKFAPGQGHFVMADATRLQMNRGTILQSSLALLAGSAAGPIASAEPEIRNVNTAPSPSNLEITDMRYAIVAKPRPSPPGRIRIETNQGVYRLV